MAAKNEDISIDEQYLRDWLAKGKQVQDSEGQPIDQANLEQFLDEVGGASGSTPKQQALHKQAKQAGMADTTQEDLKAAQKEKERLLRQQQQQLSLTQKGLSAGKSAVDPLIQRGAMAVDKVASLKTVGGVGLLVVILILLLFVVVRVNAAGDTRLKQFWYMINGRASLEGRRTLASQDLTYTTKEQQGASSAGQTLLADIENAASLAGIISNPAGAIGQEIGNI